MAGDSSGGMGVYSGGSPCGAMKQLDRKRVDAAKKRMTAVAERRPEIAKLEPAERADAMSHHFSSLSSGFGGDFWWNFKPKEEKIQGAKELAADNAVEQVKLLPADDKVRHPLAQVAVYKTKQTYGIDAAVKLAEEFGEKILTLELLVEDSRANIGDSIRLALADTYAGSLAQDARLTPEERLKVLDHHYRLFENRGTEARAGNAAVAKAEQLEEMDSSAGAAAMWECAAACFAKARKTNDMSEQIRQVTLKKELRALARGVKAVDKALEGLDESNKTSHYCGQTKEQKLINLKTELLTRRVWVAVELSPHVDAYNYYHDAIDHMLKVHDFSAAAKLSYALGTRDLGYIPPFPYDAAARLDSDAVYYLEMASDFAKAGGDSTLRESADKLLGRRNALDNAIRRRQDNRGSRISAYGEESVIKKLGIEEH